RAAGAAHRAHDRAPGRACARPRAGARAGLRDDRRRAGDGVGGRRGPDPGRRRDGGGSAVGRRSDGPAGAGAPGRGRQARGGAGRRGVGRTGVTRTGGTTGTPPRVVERERESALVDGFLAGAALRSAVLVLEGEPGIGKTTVWLAAIRRAEDEGFRVLR